MLIILDHLDETRLVQKRRNQKITHFRMKWDEIRVSSCNKNTIFPSITSHKYTMDKAVIKVRLQLFATKLKNVSGPFGCSNPFAVITLVHTGQQEYSTELGKTEV